MQIHELDNFTGLLGPSSFLAVDNGSDTGKLSTETLLEATNQEIDQLGTTLNARIDNIIAGGTAPSTSEVVDARQGVSGKTYASLGAAIRGQVEDVYKDMSSYERLNDNRFVFSENLLDSDSVSDGYYVSNTNGTLIAYNGWFSTAFMPVEASQDYAFYIIETGQTWKKPNGAYYAFYDENQIYTHGGVSGSGVNLTSQASDAYIRVSYYSGAIGVCMFGLASDLDSFLGTTAYKEPYFVAPKYERDPYNGLISAYVGIKNPYYSKRVTGNRISVTQDGYVDGAFIRFDSITIAAANGWETKSWEDFKTDIANDPYVIIMTAYDGTPDTLSVHKEYGIVYNYSTNTFHVKYIGYLSNLTKHDLILFYNDADGYPHGALYEEWSNHNVTGIKRYIRTIEQRETDLLDYGNNFVFAFATDCHWWFDDTTYHNYTNEMIEELRHCIGFDCYINGGDSIYYGTKFKLNGVASMTEAFEVNHDDYVYCIGNHDYNGVSGETQNSSWMFNAEGIESLCMRKIKTTQRPEGARYYYRDFEEKKIRVIVLDTSDLSIAFDESNNLSTPDPLVTFVIQQNQIDWLCSEALDCPSDDWGVMIVMHVGLYLAEDGFPDNNPLINRRAIINILNAYVNKAAYTYTTAGSFPVSGSGTFENAKGSLIGVWSGHAHADGYTNQDGFNAIQTECGYPDSSSRVVGTIAEICVDCGCIDMANKTITLKRFGPGSDRSYTFV